jgi:tetratricopeptide (TPR) repeat protein
MWKDLSSTVKQWKTARGLLDGWLTGADESTLDRLRDQARINQAQGVSWLTTGFDLWQPEDICRELAAIGITTSAAEFAEQFDNLPGPLEVAQHWRQQARLRHPRDEGMLWMAARALWAKWLPDSPTPETESDALEALIRRWYEAKQRGELADVLEGLERLASVCEGDSGAFEVIDDELPINLQSWLFNVLRDYREEDADRIPRWHAVARGLRDCAPLPELLECGYCRFLGNNGMAPLGIELAKTLADDIEDDFVAQRVAEVFAELGQADRAIDCAEQAILLARTDPDQESALATLKRILTQLGRAGEFLERARLIQLVKRKSALDKRKARRRTDKKGKRR